MAVRAVSPWSANVTATAARSANVYHSYCDCSGDAQSAPQRAIVVIMAQIPRFSRVDRMPAAGADTTPRLDLAVEQRPQSSVSRAVAAASHGVRGRVALGCLFWRGEKKYWRGVKKRRYQKHGLFAGVFGCGTAVREDEKPPLRLE